MIIQVTLRRVFAVFLLIGCGSVFAQFQAEQQVSPLVARLGNGFISDYAKVNGTTLHYVRGGTGPAVILLHGFPQDWYEFHQIMPRLAEKFTVVAVDLRGMGAYAFARRYPETARGVMILDVPLAGIGPWEEIQTLREVWHIRFHQTPDLPEELISGRQAIYFRYFLRGPHFSDADVAHYAESYAAPEKLRSIFEFYRAFPEDAKFNAAQRIATNLPLLLAAGEHSPFNRYVARIAEALREHGCASVKTEVIRNSAHYVADEQS